MATAYFLGGVVSALMMAAGFSLPSVLIGVTGGAITMHLLWQR